RLHALERIHDLAVRESRLLHSVELPQRENSTSDPAGSAGGLPPELFLFNGGHVFLRSRCVGCSI
ncbi:hypothetical protein, partial [Burkholderia cenocepacia]|uniref:hypothetical protein n=1 Tax=Burkholderia cenocepacia TaxID=95486 RepID=UPI001B8EAB44